MTISFELDGQPFIVLNGGPVFKINEAISFVVDCGTQQEIDDLWSKLTAGGEEVAVRLVQGQVWRVLADRAEHPGQPAERSRSGQGRSGMQAMLNLKKLDIAALQRAYDGR